MCLILTTILSIMTLVVPVWLLYSIIKKNKLWTTTSLITLVILVSLMLLRGPSGYSIDTVLYVLEYNGISLEMGPGLVILYFFRKIFALVVLLYGAMIFCMLSMLRRFETFENALLLVLPPVSLLLCLFATDWSRMLFILFPLFVLPTVYSFRDMKNNKMYSLIVILSLVWMSSGTITKFAKLYAPTTYSALLYLFLMFSILLGAMLFLSVRYTVHSKECTPPQNI